MVLNRYMPENSAGICILSICRKAPLICTNHLLLFISGGPSAVTPLRFTSKDGNHMKKTLPAVCKVLFSSLCAVAAAANADAIIDMDFDDEINDFGYSWYYYDDNFLPAPFERPQAAPGSTPSVINVPCVERPRNWLDDQADTVKVKDYTFTVSVSKGKKCATLPFTFGSPWEAYYCAAGKPCVMPHVGISAMLAREGSSIDITGVEAIRFSIKSRVNRLNEVRVMLQTLEIEEHASKPAGEFIGDEYGYYGSVIEVHPGEWQEFTIPLTDLDLPGSWAWDCDFNIRNCTRLSWEVRGNGELQGDTIDIADVYFTSPPTGSPTMWPRVETSMPPFIPDAVPAPTYFTFDSAAPAVPHAAWSAVSDRESGGTSLLNPDNLPGDDSTGLFFTPGTGSDGIGRSAAIEFSLGTTFPVDTFSYPAYAGIEMNIYDSARSEYRDLPAGGSDGTIYFQYKTEGTGIKYISFELYDINDVGDAQMPQRSFSRGTGITWFRNLTATYGEWRTIRIPFDSLVTRADWSGYNHIPLDLHRVAKFRWKAVGIAESRGVVYIDNVYFPGLYFGTSAVDPAHDRSSGSQTAGRFIVTLHNSRLQVSFPGSNGLQKGMVRIYTLRGEIVCRSPLSGSGTGTMILPAGIVTAGACLAEVTGSNTNGKPVSIKSGCVLLR